MVNTGVKLLTTLLLVCSGLQAVHNAKILAIFNLASPSHYIFNRALILALAERGHQVTVISQDQEKKPVPNVKSILLEDIYNSAQESVDYDSFTQMSLWDAVGILFDWGSTMCEKQIQTKGAQTLLNSTEKFDLIITEVAWGECFFGFIHKFGSPPVVATSGIGVLPWLSLMIGNPENPSYMPNFLLPVPLSSHMSFGERVFNFLIHNLVTFLYDYHYIPKQESIARKIFKDLPPFDTINRNFSIVLVNTVLGLDEPRPLLPNVIPIGGMHIKAKSDPLPKELQKFLDEAKDGFIYFSLGTNLRSDQISDEKRKALLDAFSEIPQRVLWKFETENLSGLPSNVKISKWLPQSDVLAHSNIKAFISHGGLMSTMEATYRAVPVVGVPFFLDQQNNIKKLVSKGVGVHLDYRTLTKQSILTALREVLQNDSYHLNMKKLSAIFKDQINSPLDRAVFWTEYVIRHKGAPHLRSAAQDLYWYQYLLLDVILVLSAGILLVVFVLYFVVKVMVRTVTKLKRKSTTKTKTN
ncbi:UDP-glycosyltransferase UGT5-like isoform X1 [Periplaneta americana]|uniref:UDP-glycosyltransferase UGT5-like isoform X1 n=1 Tax=Periplaneta americana TaxID=6978 RepID=UPI0037E820B6